MQEGAERSRAMLAELRSDPRLARQLRMAPVQTIRELPFLSLAEKTALVRLGRDVLSGWEDASGCGCGGSCGGCAGATAAKGGCSGGCGGGCAGKHTDHARAKAPRREVCAKCKGLREDCVCAELAETAWAWEAMGASVPMHVLEARAGKASASATKACCEGCAKESGCTAARGEQHQRSHPPLTSLTNVSVRAGDAGELSRRRAPGFEPFGDPSMVPIHRTALQSHDLEIRRKTSVLFARDLPLYLGANRAFNEAHLGLAAQASLGPSADPIEVRFRSPAALSQPTNVFPYASEVELELFTRAPEEHLHTLRNTPIQDVPDQLLSLRAYPEGEAEWVLDARDGGAKFNLPSAWTTAYAGPYPWASTSLAPVNPAQFWLVTPPGLPSSSSDWGGPGTAPGGFGSLKGARVMAHGPCEFELRLQDLLTQLRLQLTKTLLSGCSGISVWGLGIDVRVSIHSISGSTFLTTAPGEWRSAEDLVGGFMVVGEVHLLAGLPWANPGCVVRFRAEYVFALDDGYIRVIPTVSVTGTGDDVTCMFADVLRVALQDDLPQSVADMGRMQWIVPHELLFPCETRMVRLLGHAGPIPLPSCEEAGRLLGQLARRGYRTLVGWPPAVGDPVPPNVYAEIDAATKHGAHSPNAAGNWACVRRRDRLKRPFHCSMPYYRNDCAFIVRAQGFHVTPDAIQLKWFDDFRQIETAYPPPPPGLILFLAAIGQDPKNVAACAGGFCLCGRPYAAGRWAPKYFATFHQGPIECDDVPRVSMPDRCCEVEWNLWDQCSNFAMQPGRCIPRSPNDSVGRCGAAPCVESHGDKVAYCFPFERCVNGRCVPISQAPCDPADPFRPRQCPFGTACAPGPFEAFGPECRSLR